MAAKVHSEAKQADGLVFPPVSDPSFHASLLESTSCFLFLDPFSSPVLSWTQQGGRCDEWSDSVPGREWGSVQERLCRIFCGFWLLLSQMGATAGL